MKPTWQEDRNYIVAKYHGMAYDPSTGLDNAEIRAHLEEMYLQTRGESHALIKAKAFAYVLSSTKIDVNDHDWFVGVAEWNQKSIDGVFCAKWNAQARRMCAPQLEEEANKHSRLKTHLLYLDYCHSVPDWNAVLSLGFSGLLRRAEEYRAQREQSGSMTEEQRDYFEAIAIEYNAILSFFARVRDLALSKHSPKCDAIAECMEQLRTGAPRNIYECLQAIWLYFVISEYIDCLQVRSFGNLDQILFPYYQQDIASGRYTEADVRDFIAAFLMQASAMDYYFGHPMYLGGTKADGSSAINELSFLIVDVYDKLGIFDPKVQVKINHNTPHAFIDRLLEMIRGGHNSFNFVCEPGMTRAMKAYGFTDEEARTADIKGCYEYAVRGDSVHCGNVHINLPKALELALHDGWDFFGSEQSGPHTGKAEDFADFDSFYRAFIKQAETIYERGYAILAAYESHLSQINPTPMFSATIRTSLERAYDAYAGGVKYNASDVLLCSGATTADSLAMIQKYVYDKGELTLAQLRDILDANWEGHEELRQRILNDPDKWSNNRDLPDHLFKDFAEHLARLNNGRSNSRGGFSLTSLHNAKQFLEMGWRTAATPDGRKSGEEMSKNASAVQGMNRSGPTGAILSLSKLDSSLFMGDFPLDIALNTNTVKGPEGIAAMRGLLMAYMAGWGHAVHFNVFSAAELRKAQQEPDKYKDLQIRVCGWNALWNRLSRDEQDFYIRQAEAAE